ncbi:MAG: zinc dependent phospholipase C family protein [Acidobacteriaceae bacterium]
MRLRAGSTRLIAYFLMLLAMLASSLRPAQAYSFLTHDAMIDVAWQGSIQPLLLARFPTATEAQLQAARSYAYGGATIQDMGYYPFGHQFFSDLTHYVRSGGFVDRLLLDSQTVDEYAFALGALSHYVGDTDGHRYATNPSTPIEFPSLGKKYGPVVTYDEAPHAHVRTEFAYDVEQTSQEHFAPPGYMELVGFSVPRRLLEQAFFETYGLRLRRVLGRPAPAIKSYRSSIKGILPKVARAEVLIHHNDFPRDDDSTTYREFVTRQSKAAVDDRWGRFSRKPEFTVHLLAIVIRIVPKIGPLSSLAIRGPNTKTNGWYIESMNRSTVDYERLLKELRKNPRKQLNLPDRDLDTGNPVEPGSYALTDRTYAQLLKQVTAEPGRAVPAGLQQNVLAYYADSNAPITTKKNDRAWKRVQQELPVLRGMKAIGQTEVSDIPEAR